MDVFLGSKESWKLIAANFDQHPTLEEGVILLIFLGELLRKIKKICTGEPGIMKGLWTFLVKIFQNYTKIIINKITFILSN